MPPRSKISMMIIWPPQQGHSGRRSAAAPCALVVSRAIAGFVSGSGGSNQLPGSYDVGLTGGAGEQPVVADAVEPLGQDVEQEAPDELVRRKCHRAIPRLPVAAVILVAKGDAARVEGKQAAV